MNKLFLIFVLIITSFMMVGCSQELPPEEKALKLVKASQALGGDQSVKLTLNSWLKERGEEVRPIGWHVRKEHDEVYLVSYKYKIYSFKEGTGERGFFFEVNVDSGSVRNMTKEVTGKMGSLSSSFKKEQEISDQLMKKLGEEEKMLSGGEPDQAFPVTK
jgi:hypothetical protein